MLYEVLVLTSISHREGVACVQFFYRNTVLYEVFVLTSISRREGVACGQYFIAIQCFMKSLF